MALLRASGISKRFGGVVALSELSIGVEAGEAVGLVGPNGAGKTTLFNCLLGILRPDTGTVTFDGHDLSRMPVYRRARLGIGRTFQRIELFTEMTARDHLLVAERARRGNGAMWKDLLNRGDPTTDEQVRAAAVLSLLGIDDVADLPVEALSLGHGRLVKEGFGIDVRVPRRRVLVGLHRRNRHPIEGKEQHEDEDRKRQIDRYEPPR